ncbi:hypothetical protein QTL86_22690 [Cellulosilyticum sp. ST5]|uniref:immunity protein TriTu family protein n=1 Tax=unclassified Cellulosilyticum TaxID=2643091 RepID=UPI000F8C7546|nr:hypothetical protein [Cellulosilyticum sp. WCF-2]QEH70631.1 hypothetical protein EKH84_20475 [Cellulosilyticum sp. WCF-2]
MHKILEKWIEKNRYKLEEIGITTDEIITTSEEVELPCIRVDQSTDKCIGRICVWKDGTIDLEVLDIQTERRLMFAHYEEQHEVECFIQPYIKVILKN